MPFLNSTNVPLRIPRKVVSPSAFNAFEHSEADLFTGMTKSAM